MSRLCDNCVSREQFQANALARRSLFVASEVFRIGDPVCFKRYFLTEMSQPPSAKQGTVIGFGGPRHNVQVQLPDGSVYEAHVSLWKKAT